MGITPEQLPHVFDLFQQPAAPEAVDKNRPVAGVRVLDDHHVAGSTSVELDGHEVRVAPTGQAALEMVPGFRPRWCRLDIGLKGMDGFETAQRLRELTEGRELCLVAVAGYGDEKPKRAPWRPAATIPWSSRWLTMPSMRCRSRLLA